MVQADKIRYQKRQALSIMRKVNKAFDLPNPSSWHAKKAESIKKAILWLKSVFMSGKQQPTRVSWGYESCAA